MYIYVIYVYNSWKHWHDWFLRSFTLYHVGNTFSIYSMCLFF